MCFSNDSSVDIVNNEFFFSVFLKLSSYQQCTLQDIKKAPPHFTQLQSRNYRGEGGGLPCPFLKFQEKCPILEKMP